ncbi:YheC/YheD family protein [Anaerobacillus sp. MEB173]|uniref:YheC/YheD family endospore coat-associated protein n=1 Tax=Anaerobacillus sp. MEB173 TaxID=3383345 RepID=UPI003F8FA51B
MGDVPLIGIMVPRRKQRRKILRMYNRYKGCLKIELFCFTPKDINWFNREIQGVSIENNKWKTKMFRFPDAVYNRCYLKRAKTIRRLEKHIGENKCINRITHFNKWRIYDILSSTELDKYVPKTCLYKPKVFMNQLNQEKRLILKPIYGYLGKGIYLVELNDDHMINVYQDTLIPMYTFNDKKLFFEKMTELIGKRKYITQKVIQIAEVDEKIVDIRILVQKDLNGTWSVTNGVCRMAPYNFFITNFSEKVYEMDEVLDVLVSDLNKRNTIRQEIYDIGINVGQVLDKAIGLLGELGIDIVIDENRKVWIIEVNGKSQKKMYHMLDGAEDEKIALVYKRPLELSYYLSQR